MSFLSELKRRRLAQVGIAYLVVAWGVAQVADLLFENFQLDHWYMQTLLVVLGLGCFIAIGLAWIFDLRWDGLYRESELAKIAETSPVLTQNIDDKSIAVLPFVNRSSDPEQEYFSDGLSEELLNLLAKIPELHVAARTSAFSYKGKDAMIHDIGRELCVAHVLEGSVRRSGSKVRITAQLVRAENGYHLWSESWDRTLNDIFEVQDEIAAVVAAQLKLSLLGDTPVAMETDPEAYALYLQARHLTRQGSINGYQQALTLLRQALDIAPDYAPAWRQMGVIYLNQADRGLRPAAEGYTLGQEATEKALAIDPEYGLAHSSLGRIAISRDQDLESASRHIQKALSLEPTDASILGAAANLAQNLGRTDLAISLDEHNATLDPVQPTIHANLGSGYLIAGRAEAAIQAYRTALKLAPGAIGLHANLGLALLAQGEPKQALEEISRETNEAFRLVAQGMAYHANNQRDKSDAALEEMIEKYGSEWASNIASMLAYRGEPDGAFEWLDRAIKYQDPGLAEIDHQPEFVNIHSDPRWEALLVRIGRSPEKLAAIQFDVSRPVLTK